MAFVRRELFQYEDNGAVCSIGPDDVNDYLSAAAGERFTAKDFRAWHGTVEALELTRATSAASNAQQILMAVARRLGNTVAVCRKSYIDPQVLALVHAVGGDSNALASAWENLRDAAPLPAGLQARERRLLNLLAQPAGGRQGNPRAAAKRGKESA